MINNIPASQCNSGKKEEEEKKGETSRAKSRHFSFFFASLFFVFPSIYH